MNSACARSMKYIRDRAGKHPVFVARCEYFNTFIKRRIDLFNIFDLIWLSLSTDGTDGQIVGVQVVNTHIQDHIEKIQASAAARAWIACDGGITIHEWKKLGPRGKRKLWTLTEHEVMFERNEKGEIVPYAKTKAAEIQDREASSETGAAKKRQTRSEAARPRGSAR